MSKVFSKLASLSLFLFISISSKALMADETHELGIASELMFVGEFKRNPLLKTQPVNSLLSALYQADFVTDDAFPYGLVYLNEMSFKSDLLFLKQALNKVETAIASIDAREDYLGEKIFLSSLQSRLKERFLLGREVVDIDMSILDVQPGKNRFLVKGDVWVLPKRPLRVMVAGSVNLPSLVEFSPSDQLGDYLAKVGGVNDGADLTNARIIYPNGVMKKLSPSWDVYTQTNIIPGSIIYIPNEVLTSSDLLADLDILSIELKLISYRANSLNISDIVEKNADAFTKYLVEEQ